MLITAEQSLGTSETRAAYAITAVSPQSRQLLQSLSCGSCNNSRALQITKERKQVSAELIPTLVSYTVPGKHFP